MSISVLTLAVLFVGQTSSPVSNSDFVNVANRYQSALDKVIGLPNFEPKPSTDKSVATRTQIIKTLSEVFDHYAPYFKSHPRPIVFDRAKLQRQNKSEVFSAAEKLVKWGVVPPFSPLVTSASDSLTAHEAGDTIGYFFSRICYLTHKPLPKFTPNLEPTGE